MFSRAYNILKETRAAHNLIKATALECDGIVFGGYVRDTYLKDFMVASFFENSELDHSKFWDPKYSLETADRLLIPKDIDISFKTREDSDLFFEELKELNFKVKKGDSHGIYGVQNGNVIHCKFEATYIIGGSLAIRGRKIYVEIDVCVSPMEPPFDNIDMMTNILVEDGSGIRISCNMGSEICGNSRQNTFSKKKFETRILDMITRKESEIVRTKEDLSIKSHMIKRITKMVERGWTFTNIDWMKPEISMDFTCTVCMDATAPKTSIVINNGSHFHRECFTEYINNIRVEIDDENNHGIKCPLRGFLKF